MFRKIIDVLNQIWQHYLDDLVPLLLGQPDWDESEEKGKGDEPTRDTI